MPFETPSSVVDSSAAWLRLAIAVTMSTLGGVGMWSIVVILPAVQAEFGVDRGGASFPYAMTMVGFMIGTVVMGKLADRFGIFLLVIFGTIAMGVGYVASAQAGTLLAFAILYGLGIGVLGCAVFFAPLMADTSLWFDKHRGFAISLCASGNYFAGAIWPPILEHFVSEYGWRQTHIGIAAFCLVTMLPLALLLRPPSPKSETAAAFAARTGAAEPTRPLGLSPATLQGLLLVAGLACCVAMSMPQVHIVAYCVDLGYGPARGAEMLSLMLGFGVVSRLIFGAVLDRIGGLRTLLLGSALQAVALALYLPFDGLVSLYIISAVFGLVQGGIVPSYAVIIRELFPAREAGFRVSLVISATMAGMALGGWLSGAIYDWTGSYQAALLNGMGRNALNMSITAWLLLRRRRPTAALAA
jgi:MFS family permease